MPILEQPERGETRSTWGPLRRGNREFQSGLVDFVRGCREFSKDGLWSVCGSSHKRSQGPCLRHFCGVVDEIQDAVGGPKGRSAVSFVL